MDELFSELEAIHGEKDDYIKRLKKRLESLKDLAEERYEYFIKEKQKSNNKDNYINRLEKRLIKIEQILNSRSLTREEGLIILRN
jgi:hypothetical protein